MSPVLPALERGSAVAGRHGPLEWAGAAHSAPKAVVFAPPLIGGGAVQQLRMHRPLIRRGYDLFSFSFSGHGASGGRFSLAAALSDTRDALDHAAEQARRRQVPLFALAASYSAIPLIGAAGDRQPPFSRLVLINPLLRLSLPAVVRDFCAFCLRRRTRPPGATARIGAYLDLLFPDVCRGADRFGTLRRGRARLLTILAELLLRQPLSGAVLADTPTLCLYGRRDRVIRIFYPAMARDFEAAVCRVCPETRFQVLPGGHFLRARRTRAALAGSVLSFLSGQGAGR